MMTAIAACNVRSVTTFFPSPLRGEGRVRGWPYLLLIICATLLPSASVRAADPAKGIYDVGLARTDITPAYPIRLSGFGGRRTESEGVAQHIWAKALAIDDGKPALLITIDTCGVPANLVDELRDRLQKEAGLDPNRLAVTVTHTHTAPMVRGVLSNTLFGRPVPPAEMAHITRYTFELTDRLVVLGRAALGDLRPARLSYGIGKFNLAMNRRTKGGPVDQDLPVLVVRDLEGKVRGIYVNYACHCVTLSFNKISGDWAGYAQEALQKQFPDATALISIGCGGDANPSSGVTGDKVEIAERQGVELTAAVKRLLEGPLNLVTGNLAIQRRKFDLPMAPLPTRAQWEELARQENAIGYHAKLHLQRLDRGAALPTSVPYQVQTWTFGDSLGMVFLAGEVVVDYALRLKRDLDSRRLWINAYANDVPCYIPSERILKEGGYEGGEAMVYYDLPTKFQTGLEDKIVNEVEQMLGPGFRANK